LIPFLSRFHCCRSFFWFSECVWGGEGEALVRASTVQVQVVAQVCPTLALCDVITTPNLRCTQWPHGPFALV
jgi:hypothetical protein